MTSRLASLLILTVLIVSCEKDFNYDPNHSDDPFYGAPNYAAPEIAPCPTQENVIDTNYLGVSITMPFVDITGAYNWNIADWSLRARAVDAGAWEGCQIDFKEAPTSGKYITASSFGGQVQDNECIVRLTSNVTGGRRTFEAAPNDTIYVTTGPPGEYSMSFCNMRVVYDYQGEYKEFYASGNISIQ